MKRDAYLVTLTDAHPTDAEFGPVAIRLRRALKCLLRSFGLRCVRIEPTPAEPAPNAAHAKPGPSAGEAGPPPL